MAWWFTADTHFSHRNIIKYSSRPFATVEEMDEAMIAHWNARVAPEDTIYHLGDVAFYNREKINRLLERLNGVKHLCPGNHDREAVRARGWASIQEYREINLEGQKIVLLHYGIESFNRQHHGAIHLHGHSHGKLPGHSKRLDVGVDCWEYKPVSLGEIMERLKTLPVRAQVDHHRDD